MQEGNCVFIKSSPFDPAFKECIGRVVRVYPPGEGRFSGCQLADVEYTSAAGEVVTRPFGTTDLEDASALRERADALEREAAALRELADSIEVATG